MPIPFRTQKPRRTVQLTFRCFGAPDLFLSEISESVRKDMRKRGPIPCEGGGRLGEWCAECRFGKLEREDD